MGRFLYNNRWFIWYYIISMPIIRVISDFSYHTRAELPHVEHWSERYLAYREYVWRRHNQVDCTYEEVKDELIYKPFREAIKKFEKERDEHFKKHGAWWD